MDASATSSHDDEMLALTLGDVEHSERHSQNKESIAETSTTFETFSHENTEQNEALSMPLTLPASPTLLPLASSPSSAITTTSESRAPILRYIALDRQGVTVSEQYFHSAAGDFNAEMQKSNDEYRRLTDAINLNVSNDTSTVTSRLVSSPRKGKKRRQGTNVSIDLQTKIRIIEVAEQYQYDPKSSNRSKQEGGGMTGIHGKEIVNGIRLAEQFGLNKSTVSRILKRKEEFKKAFYKDNISGCSKHINKKSKFDKLNRLVENWFDTNREKNGTITDTLIRDVGKKYADELGIEDFRGSNGWVRSLRNRKEHTARSNVSGEEREAEQKKKDKEAIERMRNIFPNGVKDMASFFKDLSTYLEKDGAGMGGFEDLSDNTTCNSGSSDSAKHASAMLAGASCTDIDDGNQAKDDVSIADEFLKKKMIESLRVWSQELMTSEFVKLKKRMKPRQAAIL
ncbi:unnamed protein product [Peronospora belbahrii]|uniref:HTH CENPB-type domain-containing protein n=1 Tax=Peronospora belbahrii TaxID=622444 RepID=A0AAU9KMH6_9STRA|nr:unnamed protein product [Peronospora belbahrii]CAH0516813.1 unnamed protein product [Peronospora belbahrii]